MRRGTESAPYRTDWEGTERDAAVVAECLAPRDSCLWYNCG